MTAAIIAVTEIHCSSCEHTIRTALGRIDGVRWVRPDVSHNEVRVSYDEARVDEATLRQALAEVGYEPVD